MCFECQCTEISEIQKAISQFLFSLHQEIHLISVEPIQAITVSANQNRFEWGWVRAKIFKTLPSSIPNPSSLSQALSRIY